MTGRTGTLIDDANLLFDCVQSVDVFFPRWRWEKFPKWNFKFENTDVFEKCIHSVDQ